MKTFSDYLKSSGYIHEASLGRIWQHVNNKDTAFAIITAFRDEYTLSQNRRRNAQLKNAIRSNGFGFVKIIGSWIENQGTENEIKVTEESFFITSENGSELKGFIKKMIKKYDQDAAVFRNSDTKDGKAILINNNMSETPLGRLVPGKEGDFMSRIKGKGPNAKFVFEYLERDKSWMKHALDFTLWKNKG